MTQRTAKWIAWAGPTSFALSMILPPGYTEGMHQDYGFQLAWISLFGLTYGSPLAILGFLANLVFLLASLLLLIRMARGRGWPRYRFISWMAMLAAIAMTASRFWLIWGDYPRLLSFGFAFWLAGAVILAIGSWRLERESKNEAPRGFEVIPSPRTPTPLT